MGEGAIDGYASEYEMETPYSVDFKYSRHFNGPRIKNTLFKKTIQDIGKAQATEQSILLDELPKESFRNLQESSSSPLPYPPSTPPPTPPPSPPPYSPLNQYFSTSSIGSRAHIGSRMATDPLHHHQIF